MSSFGDAFKGVVEGGQRWRRVDWNRAGHIELAYAGIDVATVAQIVIVMKDGRSNAYTPSQCDMLAGDWRRVSPPDDQGVYGYPV